MTEHDDASAPPLTPEQEAHVRGLLAELRSGADGEPVPADVADRLDGTLARLVAERDRTAEPGDGVPESDASDGGEVVPLRRAWWPRVGAAAAAVVLLGAGGVAVADLGLIGSDQKSSTSSSADSGAGGSAAEQPDAADSEERAGADRSGVPSGAPTETPGVAPGARTRSEVVAALPEVSSTSFARDVGSLLAGSGASRAPSPRPVVPSDGAGTSPGTGDGGGTGVPDVRGRRMITDQVRASGCRAPATSDDALSSAVRYDDQPAVLVVHPAQDGQQLVEAWSCSGEQRLEATRLPAATGTP